MGALVTEEDSHDGFCLKVVTHVTRLPWLNNIIIIIIIIIIIVIHPSPNPARPTGLNFRTVVSRHISLRTL